MLARLRGLTPETPARWGTMDAPRMVAHLTDQFHHTLGDGAARPRRGLLRWPPVRYLAIYWIPWPKGRVKGPPGAFKTQPQRWDEDLARLCGLVAAVADRDPTGNWPDHALFGRMTGRDWGAFCYKHLDHHLRQFGQ